MTSSLVTVIATATVEVRDAEGNLVDTPTLTQRVQVTPEQARALGLDVDHLEEGASS